MSDETANDVGPRPSIPILAWLVTALWTGIVVGQEAQWSVFCGSGRAVLAVAAVGCACGVLSVVLRRRSLVSLCLMGLAAGLALGWLFWGNWRAQVAMAASAGTKWRVEVLADESVSTFGSSSNCRVLGPGPRGASVTVQWPSGVQVPALGSCVEVVGAFKAPSADDRGARACRGGVAGSFRARSVRALGWARSLKIMKQLTVVATIFMPLTLLSGIYGMNVLAGMWPPPLARWSFAAVVGSMAVIAVSMAAYFRKRNWW